MYYNLKRAMKRHKLTNAKFAKIIGICPTSMSLKITGKNEFLLSEVWNILKYFNENGENLKVEDIFLPL